VSGSGISWAVCKSTPRSRQITTPAPHHSVFYRPDALPAAQPTASKHFIHWSTIHLERFDCTQWWCCSTNFLTYGTYYIQWTQMCTVQHNVMVTSARHVTMLGRCSKPPAPPDWPPPDQAQAPGCGDWVSSVGCTGWDRASRHSQWCRHPSCRTSCRSCWRRHITSLHITHRYTHTHTHTHTHKHTFNGPFPGLPRWAGPRKVKPIWILLKQETVSGSGISWAICKSAPHSRQHPTTQVFYRPDALPAAQPTASKHWRQQNWRQSHRYKVTQKKFRLSFIECQVTSEVSNLTR